MGSLETLVRRTNLLFDSNADAVLGTHLAGLMGGRDNAVFDRNEFRCYDPRAPGWVLVPREDVARGAAAYQGKWYQEGNHKPTMIQLSASKVGGIVKQAEVELARFGFFNDAVSGAAFSNGLVRVVGKKIVIEPIRKEHRIYAEHVRAYPFLPFEECQAPGFMKFLTDAWASSPDFVQRVRFTGEYVGASMLGITWRHKDNPVLIGPKDSGKSVLLSVIGGCFPPGTTTSVSLQAMGSRFGASPLIGASLNVVTELPAASLAASELAKGLLVGDEIMVEQKYKQPFPFRCKIGHVLAGNEAPPIKDPALRDRFVFIDFPNVVPLTRQNKHLTDELLEEIPSIASWAMHTAARGVVARGHFVRPSSSARFAKEWAAQSDNVGEWASLTIAPGTHNEFMRSSELYLAYEQWCVANGEDMVKKREFGRRLVASGYERRNRGARGFLARELTDEERATAQL